MSLEVMNVSKYYKDKTALNQATVTFKPNTIYGLLGRNGAGKSTLLNIIANRSIPSEGSVDLNNTSVLNNEVLLNQIYLMSEDNLFPSSMKIKDMFRISEGFYGSFDWDFAKKMADSFELNTKQTFKKLSTGYRSIAKLITALCVPCDYIFLDEPVLGLDATHRELFYTFLIETYEERSRTFVISTHLIEEIATLLEHVVIIEQGEVKVDQETESLLRQHFALSGPKNEVLDFASQYTLIGSESLGDYCTAYLSGDMPHSVPNSLSIQPINLQQYFVQLTKRK